MARPGAALAGVAAEPVPTTAFRSTLSDALRACRSHWRFAALFSALLNLLFLAPMIYMIQVYDRVVPTQGGMTLLFLTVVLVGALMTLALLEFARSRLLVRASVRLDRRLAGAILDAGLAQPDGASAKLGRQAMRQFDTLRQVLTGPAILSLFDAPWTPIYILVCFLIHPLIGAMAASGAVLMLGLSWLNDRRTRAPLQKAGIAAGLAFASQDQSLAVADAVRALGMRRALVSRHLGERSAMMALQTRASLDAAAVTALSKFTRQVLQSLALGLGAMLAINQQISAGAIFAAAFLVGRALAPIDQLLGAWRSIVAARGAYQILGDLFAANPVDIAVTHLPAPTGRLDIVQASVSTPEGDRLILDKVDLHVLPGEVIAIVGASGAGKSTLARLIAGAVSPDEGTVRFDLADRRDWQPELLARHVGFMPQEPTLFAGTIKQNIARLRAPGPDEDDETIDVMAVEAAKRAGVHEPILHLPGGYDHALGLGGRGLSMGQAQRVSLARALFGNPRYLVLDEPNAHLDADGDQQLVSCLAEMKARGSTILVVAHKLSILPVVDKLLVMKDGRAEIFGPRDEIMTRLAIGRTRPVAQRTVMRSDDPGHDVPEREPVG
jgi:ATP-binding cassette subfamily C protein